MSAAEIIEKIKALPAEERRSVYQFVSRDLGVESSLYDEFSLVGADAEGRDVTYAEAAQAEVIKGERA